MSRGKHHDLLWTPSSSPAPLGEAALEIHARELPPRCPTPLREAWAWKHACLGQGGCGGSAGGMEPEFPPPALREQLHSPGNSSWSCQGEHPRMSCAVRGAGKTRESTQELHKFKTKRTAFGEKTGVIKTLIQITAFALGKRQSPKIPARDSTRSEPGSAPQPQPQAHQSPLHLRGRS